jgi:S1-C subfamily serine protease
MTSISKRLARLCVLLGSLLVLATAAPAAAQSTLDVERIQRATVLIMQARNVGSTLAITCVGSGTIVSRDGLILTNAHHTVPDANCSGDTLIVAMNVRPGEPPVARYQADIVQADVGLDIALLRIARQTDGRLVERSALALPFVELADSEAVQLDQTITVVGFPGIGEDPVSFERGTISGFAAEPSGGDKSWIKTSATIPAVMSGGGAYNQDGQLIGIPTTAPLPADPASGNCISVQDTNADGLINNSDICIAVTGFINLLRPSNFARPLLRAASLGLSVQLPFQQAVSTAQPTSTSRPRFRYLGFSPSVNEAGMPSTIIRSLPTGSDRL